MSPIAQLALVLLAAHVCAGVNLDIKVDILDQSGQVVSQPSSLSYYWQGSDNLYRTVNVKLSFSVNKQSITSSSVLSTPASVRIFCSQIADDYSVSSGLTFLPNVINSLSGPITTSVNFEITSNQQSPLVFCSGETVSFTAQSVNGQQITALNFVQSSDINIIINSYPTISFDSASQSTTTSVQISPFVNSFLTVYFKDTTQYSTTLTCSISPANSGLSFTGSVSSISVTVSAGSDSSAINYVLNSPSTTATFQITCTAQSQVTEIALQQYQSAQASATATISFTSPRLDLVIPNTDLTSYGFDISLPLQLIPYRQTSTDSYTAQCGIWRFDTLSALNSFSASRITSQTTCPSDIPSVTGSDLSSYTYSNTAFDWYLVDPTNSTIVLQQMTYRFSVPSSLQTIQIVQNPQVALKTPLIQYLLLLCCDSTTTSTTKYSNVVSTITLRLDETINPSIAYTPVPSTIDLLNPSYSPCTCNLMVGACDLNCCCDSECTNDDKLAFQITCAVPIRSKYAPVIELWTCNDIYGLQKVKEPDYFPIICIQFNTSTVLGKFYPVDPITNLASQSNFDSFLDSAAMASYNYRSQYLNDPYVSKTQGVTGSIYCPTTSSTPYSYGACLRQEGTDSIFRLPQASEGLANCVFDSPVRFLKSEGRVFCPITVTTDNCQDSSKLDHKKFIKNIISNENSDSIAVTTEYWSCPSDYIGTGALLSTTPSREIVLTCSDNNDQCTYSINTKLFDNTTSSTACQSDSWSSIVNGLIFKPNLDLYAPDMLETVCTKLTAAPTITQAQNPTPSCQNPLSGLQYLFFWVNGQVTRALARVIVTASVPLDSQIRQMFEIKWSYLPSQGDTFNLNQVNSYTSYDTIVTSEAFQNTLKSGYLGYQTGRPVISGVNTSSSVDTSYSNQITTYKSLNGKLCGTFSFLERQLVNFNQNISSQCVVQVTRDDMTTLNKCECLRRRLFLKLNDYFAPATRVSKNGNPNRDTYTETDWLTVYPTNRAILINKYNMTEYNAIPIHTNCTNVPYSINVFFFFEQVGYLSGDPLNEIVGAYVNYSYANWSFVCPPNENCDTYAKDFTVEMNVNFINNTKADLSWYQRCRYDQYPQWDCLSEVFWIWPNDYTDPNYFNNYLNCLGLLFGIFSLVIVYLLVIGFVCPC